MCLFFQLFNQEYQANAIQFFCQIIQTRAMDDIFEMNRRTRTIVPTSSTRYEDYSSTGNLKEKVFKKFIKRTYEKKAYNALHQKIKNLPLWLQFACLLSQDKKSQNFDYIVDSVQGSSPLDQVKSSSQGQKRIIYQISSDACQYLLLLNLDDIYWRFGFRVADQHELTQQVNLQSFDVHKHIKQLQQFVQQAIMSRQEKIRFEKIIQFWKQIRIPQVKQKHIPKYDDDIANSHQDDNMINHSHSRTPKRKFIEKKSKCEKSPKSKNEKSAATHIFNQIIKLDAKVKQKWEEYRKCGDYHLNKIGKKRQNQSCGKAQLIQSVLILKDLYSEQKCISVIQKVSNNLKKVNQNISKKKKKFLEDIRLYLQSEYTASTFFEIIYYGLATGKKQTQRGANETLKKLTSLLIKNESVKKQLSEAWSKIEITRKKNKPKYDMRKKQKKRRNCLRTK